MLRRSAVIIIRVRTQTLVAEKTSPTQSRSLGIIRLNDHRRSLPSASVDLRRTTSFHHLFSVVSRGARRKCTLSVRTSKKNRRHFVVDHLLKGFDDDGFRYDDHVGRHQVVIVGQEYERQDRDSQSQILSSRISKVEADFVAKATPNRIIARRIQTSR